MIKIEMIFPCSQSPAHSEAFLSASLLGVSAVFGAVYSPPFPLKNSSFPQLWLFLVFLKAWTLKHSHPKSPKELQFCSAGLPAQSCTHLTLHLLHFHLTSPWPTSPGAFWCSLAVLFLLVLVKPHQFSLMLSSAARGTLISEAKHRKIRVTNPELFTATEESSSKNIFIHSLQQISSQRCPDPFLYSKRGRERALALTTRDLT